MSVARAQPDRPVTHPLTGPVSTVATPTSGRNGGHVRSSREATIWGPSPDSLPPASVMARKAS